MPLNPLLLQAKNAFWKWKFEKSAIQRETQKKKKKNFESNFAFFLRFYFFWCLAYILFTLLSSILLIFFVFFFLFYFYYIYQIEFYKLNHFWSAFARSNSLHFWGSFPLQWGEKMHFYWSKWTLATFLLVKSKGMYWTKSEEKEICEIKLDKNTVWKENIQGKRSINIFNDRWTWIIYRILKCLFKKNFSLS